MPTIAVVDDDGDVLALVKEVLQGEGYDVLLYDNGRTAVDAVEINRIRHGAPHYAFVLSMQREARYGSGQDLAEYVG